MTVRWGVQNPALNDFVIGQNWQSGPVASIPTWLKDRAHRRYGLRTKSHDADVDAAWELLSNSSTSSMYMVEIGVEDETGVKNLPGNSNFDWIGPKRGQRQPAPMLCTTFAAWTAILAAAAKIPSGSMTEPMRYDLVDLGRDVLARLTTPVSQNFTAAFGDGNTTTPDAEALASSGKDYIELLLDLDTLVGTDAAFLLGSWIAMARKFGNDGVEDCRPSPDSPSWPRQQVQTCSDFYEWNARAQLSTWVNGYAIKHWNGLISGYIVMRAQRVMEAAQAAADAGKFFPMSEATQIIAESGVDFITQFNVTYPTKPVGDAVEVSKRMHAKYAHRFASCDGS
eukprot:COSAG03_NODE_1882_length_3394_cov_24.783005_2_plen_339_part_00